MHVRGWTNRAQSVFRDTLIGLNFHIKGPFWGAMLPIL